MMALTSPNIAFNAADRQFDPCLPKHFEEVNQAVDVRECGNVRRN
ncbi:hypothetical protein [Paenibacillus monticola]|nr:hypothetical protein [Paenibacillus monticola]